MRGKQLVFSLTGFLGSLIIAGVIFFQPNLIQDDFGSQNSSDITTLSQEINIDRTNERPRKGPELERWYFKQWHQPFGTVLSPELLNQMRSEASGLQDESELENSSSLATWQSVGPIRMNFPGSNNGGYTGRILDINLLNNGDILLAAASGGLWKLSGSTATPISDAIQDLAVTTMTVNPNDQTNIWVGTGEPGVRGGSGFYVTNNSGATWSNVAGITPTPNGVYKIRYWPGFPNEIHAATTDGYFRSSNGGTTWSKNQDGNISDFVFTDTNPAGRMFLTKWGENKIFWSSTFGATWNEIVLPFANVGRVALSWQSGTLYAGVARNDNNSLLGVYKSVDLGATWTNISPQENYLGQQGWYDNIILSPTQNTIYVGGVTLWKSDDDGATWNEMTGENVHPDQHAITFNPTTSEILVGNDGGLTRSVDNGATWSTSTNQLAITQYVNIDVFANNVGFIAGGSQDNGISITTDLGASWTFSTGGDGGGIAIDPANQNNIFITVGVYGGDWAFRRLRSTDGGVTYEHINNGIDPSGQWYHRIRHNQRTPINIYNNSGPFAYQSTNNGDTWTKLNPTPFTSNIAELTVAKSSGVGETVVYACLDPFQETSLWIYDNGTWFNNRVPANLPNDVGFKKVSPHPEDNNTAFIVMNGISQDGPSKKIYKTTDRGASWTNITGNLPNVPFSDVVAHPTNSSIIIASSEIGCYKTLDGGTTWLRWNDGMPYAAIVTELRFVNELSTTGKFYIVAGTYGRGIYVREVNDGTVGVEGDENILVEYSLNQNYPNPFNPATSISFSLPQQDNVELKVFDIQGREVATLVNNTLNAGKHSVNFDAENLASGIYIYTIKTSKFTQSRKMTLLK